MYHLRKARTALAATGACLVVPAAAPAQEGPPPPTAANGAEVETLARGIPTPTSFAFNKGSVFVGAFGDPEDRSVRGGVWHVQEGTAARVKGSPRAVAGVAWRKGKLYVSANRRIVVMSRWTGQRFRRKKTIYRGPKGFSGFSGIAFGPNGRLYAGVQLNFRRDRKPDNSPFARSVVSIRPNGKGIRVLATGLRQPWQLTFVKGSRYPFVSVLADERKPAPPDWIVHARPGQNYGYPACTWLRPRPCRGFPEPIALLPDHTSPMGISRIGRKLYLALFGGLGGDEEPVVVSMTPTGKRIKPFLSGYVAPVLAVGTRRGYVYTGDLTGTVYRVRAR